jgi:hypothetical protein
MREPLRIFGRGDRGNHIPPGTLVDTGMRRGHAAIRDAESGKAKTYPASVLLD